MKKITFLICISLIISPFFVIIPKKDYKIETIILIELENNHTIGLLSKCPNTIDIETNSRPQKTQLSFAAFSDTHIGYRYKHPFYGMADYLDLIGNDLVDKTNLIDFAIHLGDIIHYNTAQVNGIGLPWYVHQFKNNFKAYLVSNLNIPFHCILGNHDLNDYQMNCNDPYNLTKSLINELSMNNPIYAMMRDGILFLVLPELGYVHWTHPVEYEWIEYMTSLYQDTTTIILSHQAIEDTTKEEHHIPYRGKQDTDWWSRLFQNNSQIKMWINGHNHYLDWYVNNQSSGETQGYPIYKFGHEMAFSGPYAQLDWRDAYEEDRIVIYNISASGITTATWENNGKGGHWVSEYINSWNIPTTFDPNAEDWYSFPMFLQDNETQLTDMKLLSPNITLQLIGTKPMEFFYDAKFEAGSSKPKTAPEVLLGFGNDRSGNVEFTDPGGKIHGPTFITFPEKYPYKDQIQEDGRSGQPYQCFPIGTICAAAPGQTYNFTITARSKSGNGRFRLSVNCSDWETKTQYSILHESESEIISHTFGSNFETIHGSYTVPDNANAWFLQGILEFFDSTNYDISLFSVKRKRNSDKTENFRLYLSGKWYNTSGVLEENEMVNISIDPMVLSNYDGVMNFTAFIDGNHYGMVRVIYHEPILMSRNARFRVNNYTNGVFDLSLTKTISQISPVNMKIWNSAIFKRFPLITEFFFRFLNHGFLGDILNSIFKNACIDFKMFPFSTDSMYDQIDITADDGSGIKHRSNNGNLWLSCNCLKNKERNIKVTLPS